LIEAGLRLDRAAGLQGRHAVVVGAGSMASIAVAALRAAGVGDLVVASRTIATADVLATRAGGRAAAMADLQDEIAGADVVVTCTGSDTQVLSVEMVERAMALRSDRPLFILDVAVPRDVDPRVGELAGVALFDLDVLAPMVDDAAAADDVLEARRIVDVELAAYVSARRASGVAPTVVALRDKAAQMVAAEMHRLERRLPNLDDVARAEIAATVQRVVDKVLHAPTVRVQELADTVGPTSYPEALRRLFDLDPSAPAALVAPDSAAATEDAEDEIGQGEQR